MRPPRKLMFIFWMAWLVVFIVVEAWAIFSCGETCTLSSSIWFLQRSWWPLTVILAVLFAFLIWHFLFDRRSRKETPMAKPTQLVVQATKQPIRKVRFAGIAAAGLVVAAYVLSVVSGNEPLISQEAALDALGTLGATFAPLLVAWFTKSAVVEAGE